jgi:hypothetical protein
VQDSAQAIDSRLSIRERTIMLTNVSLEITMDGETSHISLDLLIMVYLRNDKKFVTDL